MPVEPHTLSAAELARQIRGGAITAVEAAESCLARIKERESEIGAFTHIDEALVMQQAEALDEHKGTGHSMGPLHGVPIGLKDIIDTEDMPTEYGTPIYAGNQPRDDATLTAALKSSGALIMGKTVTTELAFFHPGKTKNPHNTSHTPGGSSSGSAAAVADTMIPGAIGSQTAGSIIRPASFCGIFGYKPTFGDVSRHGVITEAQSLDTMGPMARSVEDLALIGDALSVYDARDGDMRPRSRGNLHAVATSKPPATPNFAFVRTPHWDQADESTQEAFEELVKELGDNADETPLPSVVAAAYDYQQTIQIAEMTKNYGPLMEKNPDQLSEKMKETLQFGKTIPVVDYILARDMRAVLNAGLAEVFKRYDAILTPAAPGIAPATLEMTGSPIFNGAWTYLGLPCVTLPLFEVDGMPLGAQLVGPMGDDARLLRTAQWMVDNLMNSAT